MSRTTIAGVFVVLLVVTAGCLGGGASLDSTTAADTTDENAESGGGGDGGGSGDASIVEDRMAALEAAGSYSAVWRMESVEDGTKVGELTYVTKVDYENERYSFQMTTVAESETESDIETYYSDGKTYQKYGDGDETAVTSNEGEFGSVAQSTQTAFISSSEALDDFTYTGTETFDGVTVERYEMNEVAPWVSAQQQADGEVTWKDFNYVVLVDEQGLVRSEHWEGNGVDDQGTEVTIRFTYEVTGVGSTEISEPTWLGQASS